MFFRVANPYILVEYTCLLVLSYDMIRLHLFRVLLNFTHYSTLYKICSVLQVHRSGLDYVRCLYKYSMCSPQLTSTPCFNMCCVFRCRGCQHGQTDLHGRWSGGGIQRCAGAAHLHGSQCYLLWTGWHWTGKDACKHIHSAYLPAF